MTDDIWNRILGRIETQLNRHSFDTWFRATALVDDTGNALTVRVPHELCRNWINQHYRSTINDIAEELRPGVMIKFVLLGEEATATAPPPRQGPVNLDGPIRDASPATTAGPPSRLAEATSNGSLKGLSARYTFDTFVVGPSNQLAHAASLAIAEQPARSYNPLFLYGGPGLGKTHLLHAIGHYLLSRQPDLKVTYIEAERFMTELVYMIGKSRQDDFRARYRALDVLLMDDVQFLAGTERTQVELFHTFNALHGEQKQLVLTSDNPPHKLMHIEERLRSRFGWGLIADIQPPDLETRVAILKKKSEADATPISNEVALYIASGVRSNVRDLEGCLTRLIATCSMNRLPVTLESAQAILHSLVDRERPEVTIDRIQTVVADHYRMKPSDLKGRNNSKAVVEPRQIAMFLCRSLTKFSLPQIGRSFGGRDHSTVVYSIRKVESRCENDREFQDRINSFMESFR